MKNGYKKKTKGTKETHSLYHWLENGNNKKALQEADKVLKRQPDLHCIRALKCVALSRLGKEAECVELLEAVRKEKNLDEATLQAITLCYREIHRPELICELYKSVQLEDPSNEEVLGQLFFSYVRISDYTSQQRTAMSLYKVCPKLPIYFRAVVSILLQCGSINDVLYYCLPPLYREKGDAPKLGEDVLVKLAERMVVKFVDKLETEQDVELYLIILKMRGDSKAVLGALESPLGARLQAETLRAHKVETLINLERWAEAWELLKTMINNSPDNWDYLLYLMDISFQLGEAKVREVKKFINQLCQKHRKRGPILAKIEMNQRLHGKEAVKLMMEYIGEFGDCECCFRDLQAYLAALSESEAAQLLKEICAKVGLSDDAPLGDKDQMNLHISNMEIASGLCVKPSPVFTTNCLKYFIQSQIFNTDTQSTETRSSDRYALLAAHALYKSWLETNDNHFLYEGLTVCIYGLGYSPSNSQLKLLAIKFYHLLGCGLEANEAYLSLEAKHMQLDSLGYLHVFPLLALGLYTKASVLLNMTMRFFIQNYRDSAEHIIFAYKCNAFSKIPEFISIKDKLSNSLHFMMVTVERMLLEILQCSSFQVTNQALADFEPTPHLDKLKWDKLQDNRDFNVMWEYGPGKVPKAIITQSYNQELALFRIRHLILRVVYAVLKSEIQMLPGFMDELIEIHQDLKANQPSQIGKEFIGSPPDSRLLIYVQTSYLSVILDLMNLLVDLESGARDSAEQRGRSILAYFATFLDLLSTSKENPARIAAFIKFATVYVEASSLAFLFLGAVDSLIGQLKQMTKKTKKKKETSPTPPPLEVEWRTEVYRKLSTGLQNNIAQVESILSNVETPKFDLQLTDELEDQSEAGKLQKVASSINETLLISYKSSFEQLSSVLKLKLKYLKH